MRKSLSTMIRSSAATGCREWKLGPVGAIWKSGSKSLRPRGVAPLVGIAHQDCRHALRPLRHRIEDRADLAPAPEAREVEVHAHHADGLVAYQQLGHDGTARLEGRELQSRAVDHSDMLLHEERIAVPADAAGIYLQQCVEPPAAGHPIHHAAVLRAEVDWLVEPVLVDQLVRHRGT